MPIHLNMKNSFNNKIINIAEILHFYRGRSKFSERRFISGRQNLSRTNNKSSNIRNRFFQRKMQRRFCKTERVHADRPNGPKKPSFR